MTPETLFEFHGGLHLKDSVLWFDAPTPKQLCFVSHGSVNGALGHQKILTTETTSELLSAMSAAHGRGRRVHEPQALVSPYGRSFSLGQLGLELFPSGFVLGSASLLVRHKGVAAVYAGAINPSHVNDQRITEAEVDVQRDAVWARTDGNNTARKTTYIYDKLGRLSSTTGPDPSFTVAWKPAAAVTVSEIVAFARLTKAASSVPTLAALASKVDTF